MKKARKVVSALWAATVLLASFCGCTAQVQVTSTPTETVQTQNETGSQPESTQPQETQENPQSATNLDDRWEQMQAATLQYPSSNDEWEYNVYDCYVELTEYIGEQKPSLVIPDTIENLPVWVIDTGFLFKTGSAKSSYTNNNILTSVMLPDSLLVIGESVFENASIATISFPENLLIIGKDAFWGCKELADIKLPQKLKEIGEFAFSSCELTEVTIPNSVEKIKKEAFYFRENENCAVTVLNPNAELEHGCFAHVSTIRGYAGSTAAQYCAENEIDFQVIE